MEAAGERGTLKLITHCIDETGDEFVLGLLRFVCVIPVDEADDLPQMEEDTLSHSVEFSPRRVVDEVIVRYKDAAEIGQLMSLITGHTWELAQVSAGSRAGVDVVHSLGSMRSYFAANAARSYVIVSSPSSSSSSGSSCAPTTEHCSSWYRRSLLASDDLPRDDPAVGRWLSSRALPFQRPSSGARFLLRPLEGSCEGGGLRLLSGSSESSPSSWERARGSSSSESAAELAVSGSDAEVSDPSEENSPVPDAV